MGRERVDWMICRTSKKLFELVKNSWKPSCRIYFGIVPFPTKQSGRTSTSVGWREDAETSSA
jgi:hypothetical protein